MILYFFPFKGTSVSKACSPLLLRPDQFQAQYSFSARLRKDVMQLYCVTIFITARIL